MTDFYTPAQNGIEGLEEFGDGKDEFGAVFCELKYSTPVDVDGVRVVGPTYEPALVAEFFRVTGIRAVVRTVDVFSENRRGWRTEQQTGLPDALRARTGIASGALAFVPGWDSTKEFRLYSEDCYQDASGSHHGEDGIAYD